MLSVVRVCVCVNRFHRRTAAWSCKQQQKLNFYFPLKFNIDNPAGWRWAVYRVERFRRCRERGKNARTHQQSTHIIDSFSFTLPASRLMRCRSALHFSTFDVSVYWACSHSYVCAAVPQCRNLVFSLHLPRFNTPTTLHFYFVRILCLFFLLRAAPLILPLVLSACHLDFWIHRTVWGPCDGERSRDTRIITMEKKEKEKKSATTRRRNEAGKTQLVCAPWQSGIGIARKRENDEDDDT